MLAISWFYWTDFVSYSLTIQHSICTLTHSQVILLKYEPNLDSFLLHLIQDSLPRKVCMSAQVYFSQSTTFFWQITSSTSLTTIMTSIFTTIFATLTHPNQPSLRPLTSMCQSPLKWQWQQQELKKYHVSSPKHPSNGLYHHLDLRYISFFFFFSFY